jgi:hypothetical protein
MGVIGKPSTHCVGIAACAFRIPCLRLRITLYPHIHPHKNVMPLRHQPRTHSKPCPYEAVCQCSIVRNYRRIHTTPGSRKECWLVCQMSDEVAALRHSQIYKYKTHAHTQIVDSSSICVRQGCPGSADATVPMIRATWPRSIGSNCFT